jgi:hypothetical protein
VATWRTTPTTRTRVRSIEEALGDLVEKHDRLPRSHPDRQPLERMICILQAEVALRAARLSKTGGTRP